MSMRRENLSGVGSIPQLAPARTAPGISGRRGELGIVICCCSRLYSRGISSAGRVVSPGEETSEERERKRERMYATKFPLVSSAELGVVVVVEEAVL